MLDENNNSKINSVFWLQTKLQQLLNYSHEKGRKHCFG